MRGDKKIKNKELREKPFNVYFYWEFTVTPNIKAIQTYCLHYTTWYCNVDVNVSILKFFLFFSPPILVSNWNNAQYFHRKSLYVERITVLFYHPCNSIKLQNEFHFDTNFKDFFPTECMYCVNLYIIRNTFKYIKYIYYVYWILSILSLMVIHIQVYIVYIFSYQLRCDKIMFIFTVIHLL